LTENAVEALSDEIAVIVRDYRNADFRAGGRARMRMRTKRRIQTVTLKSRVEY